MLPVYGISKLWLEVRQLERSIHFYRDVLRLPLVKVERNAAVFDVDGQQLIVSEPTVFEDGSVAGIVSHWAMAIHVDDEARYVQKIRQSGGTVYDVGFGHYIDDPDANLVELWHNHVWQYPRRGPLFGWEIAPVLAFVETALMCIDPAQGLHFYRDLLGLDNLDDMEEQGAAFMRGRLASGQDILLFYPGTFMGTTRGGRNMRMTLATASVEDVAAFLQARDIAHRTLNGRLYFNDPFGHTYEVEKVDTWPLPPSGDPEQWSFPRRPTESFHRR